MIETSGQIDTTEELNLDAIVRNKIPAHLIGWSVKLHGPMYRYIFTETGQKKNEKGIPFDKMTEGIDYTRETIRYRLQSWKEQYY